MREQQTAQAREKELKHALEMLQNDLDSLQKTYSQRKGELQTMGEVLVQKQREHANMESIIRFVEHQVKEQNLELETAKRRHRELVEINNREGEKLHLEITTLRVLFAFCLFRKGSCSV